MIFDSLIKPALDSVTGIIKEFHLSPEDKLKAEQALIALHQQAEQQANDYEVKLNDIAGQNIRADAQSEDKFTQRARPLFMYIVEAILGFNYIGVPLLRTFNHSVEVLTLPGDLLTLFGVCVTGYVFARTAEKTLSLPGSSTFSFLGLRAGNDGPGLGKGN